jgi:hypothetical protein
LHLYLHASSLLLLQWFIPVCLIFQYPSLLDDSHITHTALLPGSPSPAKQVNRHVILIRRIQSEIQRRLHRVNPGGFEGEGGGDNLGLKGAPGQDWMDGMLERLKVWLGEVPTAESSSCTAEQWAVMFHSQFIFLLPNHIRIDLREAHDAFSSPSQTRSSSSSGPAQRALAQLERLSRLASGRRATSSESCEGCIRPTR